MIGRGKIYIDADVLVEGLKQKDNEAVEEMYNTYCNKVYYFIRRYIADETDAEDVVQETFIAAIQSVGTFERKSKFETWLLGIARNKALMYLRKNKDPIAVDKEDTDVVESLEEEMEFLPGEVLESSETAQYVVGLIDQLPINQKKVVLMYYYEEMKVTEIAQEMNVSDGTVKSWLNYARSSIKKDVELKTKKGYKVIAVTPVPIITQVMRMFEVQQIIEEVKKEVILKNVKANVGVAAPSVGVASILSRIVANKMAVAVVAVVIAAVVATTVVIANKPKTIAPVSANEVATVQAISTTTEPPPVATKPAITETQKATEVPKETLVLSSKSDYAKFYYNYVQNTLIQDSNFADAEIIDFDNNGAYDIFLMFYNGVDYRCNYYLYEDMLINISKGKKIEGKHDGISFSGNGKDEHVYPRKIMLVEFDGVPNVLRETLTKPEWDSTGVQTIGHLYVNLAKYYPSERKTSKFLDADLVVHDPSFASQDKDKRYGAFKRVEDNDYTRFKEPEGINKLYNEIKSLSVLSTCGVSDEGGNFKLTKGERLKDYFDTP